MAILAITTVCSLLHFFLGGPFRALDVKLSEGIIIWAKIFEISVMAATVLMTIILGGNWGGGLVLLILGAGHVVYTKKSILRTINGDKDFLPLSINILKFSAVLSLPIFML